MAAERQPGSNRGRPALDWDQAFLYYAALPPEQRDYAAVAAEFAVSPRTVERHGRKQRWRERARELDREASRTAAGRLVEERAARLTDLERLAEASLVGYAQKLREGKVRLSPADLPRLHKLLRELWEEPEVQPSEPSEPLPAGEELDPVAHKLQVLQALHEAGVLEQLEQLRERRAGRGEDETRGDGDGERDDRDQRGHRGGAR